MCRGYSSLLLLLLFLVVLVVEDEREGQHTVVDSQAGHAVNKPGQHPVFVAVAVPLLQRRRHNCENLAARAGTRSVSLACKLERQRGPVHVCMCMCVHVCVCMCMCVYVPLTSSSHVPSLPPPFVRLFAVTLTLQRQRSRNSSSSIWQMM